jgi:hypothetical protein
MNVFSGSCLAAAALLCAVSAGQTSAATLTMDLGPLPPTAVLNGTLASVADVQLDNFALSSATALTVFTTSYGGGMNSDGTTTAAGGFEPLVALYDTSGSVIAQTTGSYPNNTGDATTGIVGDSYFATSSLMAGSYILAIANWDTTGDPVSGFVNPGSGSAFLDTGGNTRTGNYSADIASSTVASTPEPASFWLTLPAAAGMLVFLRNRRKQSKI